MSRWRSYAAPLLLCVAGCWQQQEQARTPRYKLVVGQHLVYDSSGYSTYGEQTFTNRAHWDVWVIGKDTDGTAHLLILHATDRMYGEGDHRVDRTLMSCTLSPDGRVHVEGDLYPGDSPIRLFPSLPVNPEQRRTAWSSKPDSMGTFESYRVLPRGSEPGTFVFAGQHYDPIQKITLWRRSSTLRFNTRSGLLQERVDRDSEDGGQGVTTTRLKQVRQLEPATLTRLAAYGPACVAAFAEYDRRLEEASKDVALAGDLDRINAPLKEALGRVSDPLMRELLAERIAKPERSIEWLKRDAANLAAVLNQPCPDFSLTDFEGRTHSLSDYRGKVVAMDFWYRGCWWCVRAMPQVQQVATDFSGQPFVMLGMNKDYKDEDAQFVIREMGLTYLNLKAKDFCETMRVKAFPTLILVDREGIVRHVEIGWSPTLRQNVSDKIRALLGAPATRPATTLTSR